MNFSDSEIVASVMTSQGFDITEKQEEADIIFINTCSIREHAENRVINRLRELQHLRKNKPGLKLGVLGCMAERMKASLLEDEELGMRIDMVAGPDAYRQLPGLLDDIEGGQQAINVMLLADETYADISPVRYAAGGVSAFVSIMRGCENYCAYCVVPYTRGKERSREPGSIIDELRQLAEAGYREVTLLGQNVNSYKWRDNGSGNLVGFSDLISMAAEVDPGIRIRFATSHPRDISEELLHKMAEYPNICRAIHLPVQSGSNAILKKMNRKYTRESYLKKIEAIKRILPGCAISTDIIAGFCSETEMDHKQTISLMEEAGFDFSFMFKYSERPGTAAAKKFRDDVPEHEKTRRLNEIIQKQQEISLASNKKDIGKTFEVLVEGSSRRSKDNSMGRTSQNKVVVFPSVNFSTGEYVKVRIDSCTSATLKGKVV